MEKSNIEQYSSLLLPSLEFSVLLFWIKKVVKPNTNHNIDPKLY